MSFHPFYTPVITLIDKTSDTVTPVDIEGDATSGNLVLYRLSGKYPEPAINKTRFGSITLRAPDGLFITKAPILTDENAFDAYEANVQFFQPLGADPVGRAGPILRYEISKAEWDTTDSGTYVNLTLTGGEIRTEQHLDSDALRFFTPKQAFLKRLSNYAARKGSSAPVIAPLVDDDIDLPDIPLLKQLWKPLQPIPLKKLLNEIITRISSPEAIGTSNEDYYYYIENHATIRKQYNIFAEKFGEQDSAVILDEIDDGTTKTVQTQQSAEIDNSKRYNTIILRGASGIHHLPMGSTRLISDLEHAKLADAYSGGTTYEIGDYVRDANKRYKSLTASNLGSTPASNPSNWEDLEAATRGTPWTLSADQWKPNMSDWQTPPAGYVGFMTDMNIVKPNYDRDDETNEFESVSIKDVEDFLIDPSTIPSGEIQHGRRWLLNNSATGAWAGKDKRIAQYDESKIGGAGWQFSKLPVLNDVVNLHKSAQVLKFDGVDWTTIWQFSVDYATSSPFHPVESIGMVADHRGILRKAVEFRFNWNAAAAAADWVDTLFQLTSPILSIFGVKVGTIIENTLADLTDFLDKTTVEIETDLGLGNVKNLAGRFCGFELRAPFPRNASGVYAVGDMIKQSHIDFENKSVTLKNTEGWNEGLDSEDLGDIRGLQFRVKVDFQNKYNDTINGMADIPFYACWRDIADRQIWTTAKVRFNGEYGKITIDAGPRAKGYQIFDSRIDELVTILGFTLPQNFFIKERELTGVRFDWNHVTGFKFYYKGSYDDNHFYTGSQGFFLAALTEHITQAFANLAFYTGGIIDVSEHIVDHAHIAVTDFHFLKDAYVSSNNSKVLDCRMKMVVLPEQTDYVDMKSIDLKIKSRHQFFPQFHTVDAWGDVRTRVGRRLKRRGKNIAGGEIELVPSEVTHIEDGTGYHMLVKVVNKFEVPP